MVPMVTYSTPTPPASAPLARLAWSCEAMVGLADAMRAAAERAFVVETYARIGRDVPPGLLP